MDKGGQNEIIKVVIDASVAVKWAIPGEPWEYEARILKDRIASGDLEAHAPPLILYEVASVLSRAIGIDVITPSHGAETLKAIGELGINIKPIGWNTLKEVLDIAQKTKLTIYDAAYLWISKMIDGILITADKELAEKGRSVTKTLLLGDLTQTFT